MITRPIHRAQVFSSPWAGVYGTHLESERHFGRHWHAVYGLGLLEDGAQRSASGRGTVAAYAGDLICTNPGEVHDGQALGGLSRRWRMVYVEPSVMATMAGHPDDTLAPNVALTQPVFQNPALRQALRSLLASVESWNTGLFATAADALACEEALVAVCAGLLAQHSTAAPQPEVRADVRLVRERLADNPLQAPTLTELAELAGISKFQVLRRFEKVHGLTPYAWLLQQRTELARRQICAGASLADAAAASGFADQSHMTRVFSRQFGFTPGVLRQATQG
ncbi:AraC family transcriptional regulator [Rhodoferax sp.]|uniref:AraC family transcriptional regulator n=1 Tax=Rhodoferax sp. TaxID=50421 RepID=UPI00283DB740|nr:AraC family transcriptional regulator [Rhodoferax sp.]MDR3370997.1 AraC family transcriptional regulator [Rhodoferax sp.]